MKTKQKKSEFNIFVYLALLPDSEQRRLLGLKPLPERFKKGKKKAKGKTS